MPDQLLNEIEQFVLLALVRLGKEAYGVTVRREIEEKSGRPVSIAAAYAALDRLRRRGCVETWLSEPSSERGGRAKKHFRITSRGARLLQAHRQMMQRMWEDVDLSPHLEKG